MTTTSDWRTTLTTLGTMCSYRGMHLECNSLREKRIEEENSKMYQKLMKIMKVRSTLLIPFSFRSNQTQWVVHPELQVLAVWMSLCAKTPSSASTGRIYRWSTNSSLWSPLCLTPLLSSRMLRSMKRTRQESVITRMEGKNLTLWSNRK